MPETTTLRPRVRTAVRPLTDWRTLVRLGYLLTGLPMAFVTGYLLLFALPLSIVIAVASTVLPLVLTSIIRAISAVLDRIFRLIVRHPLFDPNRPLPPARVDRLRRRVIDPAGWLVLVLPVAWGVAAVERFLAGRLADTDIPSPYLLSAPSTGDTVAAWYRGRTARAATWRDLGFAVLAVPLGLIWAASVYLMFIAPVLLASTLIWYWFAPGAAADLGETIGIHADTLPKVLLVGGIGLVAVPILIGPLRVIARARARLAARLLDVDPYAEVNRRLAAQVTEQRTARAAAVRVADSEQQRIERDLHDGAQQRLVALALDLSRAKRKFTTDPEQAYALVDEAQQEAKRAIVELRNLARGIRPPILTDRGLDAAISALAGRASVPIEVDVRLPQRPPPPVESAAYFVVAEALTNVDKHAQAERAAIWVTRTGDRLVIEIRDNGRGGAAASGHSGLTGLADRVASLDGSLQITSPVGGPTIIHAELPCES
ncbi:MAG TPA: sensor histidine kinase [Mycobacteriales bacterium]|nr:sensor histidine kinase [Mycobacteriales bacterium]